MCLIRSFLAISAMACVVVPIMIVAKDKGNDNNCKPCLGQGSGGVACEKKVGGATISVNCPPDLQTCSMTIFTIGHGSNLSNHAAANVVHSLSAAQSNAVNTIPKESSLLSPARASVTLTKPIAH